MSNHKLHQAVINSGVASVGRQASADSVVVALARTAMTRAQSIRSELSDTPPQTPPARAIEHSVIVRFVQVMVALSRTSFSYRWLTSEPKPNVVYINLHETYTLGPVISLLFNINDRLYTVWRAPKYHGLRGMFTTLKKVAGRSITGRILLTTFEPPNPSEDWK